MRVLIFVLVVIIALQGIWIFYREAGRSERCEARDHTRIFVKSQSSAVSFPDARSIPPRESVPQHVLTPPITLPSPTSHGNFLSTAPSESNLLSTAPSESNLLSTSTSQSNLVARPTSHSNFLSTAPSESKLLSTSTRQSNLAMTPPSNLPAPAPQYLIFIVVLSTSSKKGRDARYVIRKTWIQKCQNRVPPILVKFAIGTDGLSHSEKEELINEDKIHNDLLLLANLHDTYNNLTRKVLYSFIWANQNIKFLYLLKTDDDTFVFVDELYKQTYQYYQAGTKKLYWGHFTMNQKVKKRPRSKWAEYNWFLCDHYLPYAFGGGYVISADLIHNIASMADYLQLYHNEDVSVGVWLSAYKIQRKNDGRFRTGIMNGNMEKCEAHTCILVTALSRPSMYRFHLSTYKS